MANPGKLNEEELRSKLEWEEKRVRTWMHLPGNMSVLDKLKILDKEVPLPEGERWVEIVRTLDQRKR